MRHSFVWVDIPVADLDRALVFYSAVLGHTVTREGGPGFSFGLFPHEIQGVGGCLYRPDGDNAPSRSGPLIYLNAEGRLNDAVQAVRAHGGQVEQAPHQIGPHGWRAIAIDCEGNRIALHSPTA